MSEKWVYKEIPNRGKTGRILTDSGNFLLNAGTPELARLIVKAHNNHDELVELIRIAQEDEHRRHCTRYLIEGEPIPCSLICERYTAMLTKIDREE